MIRVAFCDDDQSVLNDMSVLLERYRTEHSQEIVYTVFHSPLELLAEFSRGMSVDILFLDVIMPGENGINTAREIRQYDSNVKIIFLTSSAEYAVESYKVDAWFYQMKPVCEESFFKLMDSVVEECSKARQSSLIMRCKNGIMRIDLEKLQYCEVIGRTLVFHMNGGKVLESIGSLDKLCGELAQYENFLRPHRSFLVNMEYIQSISGRAITMDDHTEIPVPHGKTSDIKSRYLEYAFNRKQVFQA